MELPWTGVCACVCVAYNTFQCMSFYLAVHTCVVWLFQYNMHGVLDQS